MLALLEHWEHSPPINEMAYLVAPLYTSWRHGNGGNRSSTPAEIGEAVAAMGGVSLPAAELPAWMRMSLEALKTQGKPN